MQHEPANTHGAASCRRAFVRCGRRTIACVSRKLLPATTMAQKLVAKSGTSLQEMDRKAPSRLGGRHVSFRCVCKAAACRRSETVANARHKLQRKAMKYHVELHHSLCEAARRRYAVQATAEAAGKQRQIASERTCLICEFSSSRERESPSSKIGLVPRLLRWSNTLPNSMSPLFSMPRPCVLSATAWLLRTRCPSLCWPRWTDKWFRSCLRGLALLGNSSSATTESFVAQSAFAVTRCGPYHVWLLPFAMERPCHAAVCEVVRDA